MTTPDRSSTLLEIAGRIAEERIRLGMTQAEFGGATQTHRNTVRHYETGERKPDPLFLAALGNMGIDLFYVLTGARQVAVRSARSGIAVDLSPEVIADKVLAVGDKRSAAQRIGAGWLMCWPSAWMESVSLSRISPARLSSTPTSQGTNAVTSSGA